MRKVQRDGHTYLGKFGPHRRSQPMPNLFETPRCSQPVPLFGKLELSKIEIPNSHGAIQIPVSHKLPFLEQVEIGFDSVCFRSLHYPQGAKLSLPFLAVVLYSIEVSNSLRAASDRACFQ